MRIRIVSGAIAAIFALSTAAALADLGTGTLLNGTITQAYSSKDAYVGQPVKLTNVTNDNGSGTVVGGTLYGRVSEVQKASQGRAGKIAFSFTRLVTQSGNTYSVDGEVTKMKAVTQNNALKEAGGALVGMLVGNALFKSLLHMGGGGIIGAAGGYLIAKNSRENISVAQGTIVQVQLNSITRRQAR
jgi:hypothetical protein